MFRKPVTIWIVLSVVAWIGGNVWRAYGDDNPIALILFFIGWVSTLLSIGYFSTPSHSAFGKVAFGFVILMVAGIVMKMLHLPGGDAMILFGLFGVAGTYGVMWFRKKPS